MKDWCVLLLKRLQRSLYRFRRSKLFNKIVHSLLVLELDLLGNYFWIRSVGLCWRLEVLIWKYLLFFLVRREFIRFDCCWFDFFFDRWSFSKNCWLLDIALGLFFLGNRNWSLKFLLNLVCSNLRASCRSSNSGNFRFSSLNWLRLGLDRFLRCFAQLSFDSKWRWLFLLNWSLDIDLRWRENWFSIIICFDVQPTQRNPFFRSWRVFVRRSWNHSFKWTFFFLKLSDSLLSFSVFLNS